MKTNRLFIAILVAFLPFAGISAKDFTKETKFRKAVPVWENGTEAEPDRFVVFQADFNVRGNADRLKERNCRVRLTASTDYRLKVNGEFVGHGPCVAAHGFYRIDSYAISKYLKKGNNTVTIEVAGYNTPSYYLLNQPSFLQAEIFLKGRVVAATGRKGFSALLDPTRRPDAPRFSFQRPTGEAYVLGGAGIEEEDLELSVQPEKTLISRNVPYPDYRLHDAALQRAGLYSFDCNSSGFLGLEFKASAPGKFRVKFDEILDGEGNVNEKRLTCNAFIDFEIKEAGDYSFESFEPYTMKYLQIEAPEEILIKKVYMRDYCNSDVWKAVFESDNPALDRLFEVARETFRQSSLDVFMDTPSRERAGWLCDSYFSSRVAFDFSGRTLVEENFLGNYLLPERFEDIDEGMLPMCYPSDHWNHNYIPNWAMWFVLEMEEYYGRTGDRKMLENARERIYKLISFFDGYLNSDGLLESLPKWVFVEWSDANGFVQDLNYPSNMLYAGMLDAAARMYSDEALAERAAIVRETIRTQSFDGQFFRDNAMREDDGTLRLTTNHTEVCQYYAFFFDVATPETYPELWNTLKTEFGPIRKTVNKYPTVGFANAFIGNYLRLELLSMEGLTDQLISEVIDEYTKMADLTGTLWENMTTTASCNHGFASHIAHVLFRDVLGVYKVDPIGKTVTLRFTESGVRHCKGEIPVGKEFIKLEWTADGEGGLDYRIDVPKGWKVVEDKSCFYFL